MSCLHCQSHSPRTFEQILQRKKERKLCLASPSGPAAGDDHLPFQGELLLDDGRMLQVYETALPREIESMEQIWLTFVHAAAYQKQWLPERRMDKKGTHGNSEKGHRQKVKMMPWANGRLEWRKWIETGNI
jgi:hypothetical protein